MKKTFISTLLILIYCQLAQSTDIRDYLPESFEVRNYPEVETRIIRTQNDLFDYMNGGAENYIAFNFRRLAVREFAITGDVQLIVEIYFFKSPADAYGVFTMLPAGDKLQYGDGGGYSIGVVRFWKGAYYCKIITTGSIEKYKEVLLMAGEAVDGKIDASGSPPEIVSIMPIKDRTKEGLHFFHEYISQKNLLYIAPHNVLNLTRDTNVVLAEYYNLKAERAHIFLIQYPTDSKCRVAYKGFVSDFLGKKPAEPDNFHLKAALEDYRMVEIDRLGEYFIIGFEDNHQQLLTDRMKELRQNLRQFMNE
ncbi:MAG: hypothetical protein HQ591_00785 [candidate division Zixibacteria bacterium]|nr:hypothetical protein [Candidatus Tariuqbacter arcticus]